MIHPTKKELCLAKVLVDGKVKVESSGKGGSKMKKVIREYNEWCTLNCKNKECCVNYKNRPKGTVSNFFKNFMGTDYCKGAQPAWKN